MASGYTDQLTMKLLPDQREAWLDAAGQCGIQELTTWIRLILDHAAGIGEIHDQMEAAARAHKSSVSRRNAVIAREARMKKLKGRT